MPVRQNTEVPCVVYVHHYSNKYDLEIKGELNNINYIDIFLIVQWVLRYKQTKDEYAQEMNMFCYLKSYSRIYIVFSLVYKKIHNQMCVIYFFDWFFETMNLLDYNSWLPNLLSNINSLSRCLDHDSSLWQGNLFPCVAKGTWPTVP